MRLLLEAGASPACQDAAGMRPLHRAALFGSEACCRALLQAGERGGCRACAGTASEGDLCRALLLDGAYMEPTLVLNR